MRQILGLSFAVCFSLLAWSAASDTQASTKLYVFDCGSLSLLDVTSFGLTNDETSAREMFVPCYMIEHDGQRMLWDAGLPLGIAGKGQQSMPGGFQLLYENSLIDQLQAMQLKPVDFDFVAYSHFHFDHIGAANAFAAVPLLIQQDEFVAAFEQYEDFEVFDIEQYRKVTQSPRIILNGDHDVFGDGSVTIISAPGHTPGHQTLLVKLENYGPVLLSGDLYHFEETRTLRRVPDFNIDANQTLKSMEKIEAVIQQTGAILWIEHVKAQADTLNKAPAYYD